MNRHAGAWCLIWMLLAAPAGCVRPPHPEGDMAAVEVLQSQPVRLDAKISVPGAVYVAVRDSAGAEGAGLRALVEQYLVERGFTVATSPIHAGYILQIDIVHAAPMDAAAARRTVPRGYGGEKDPAGQGACVLMADILAAIRAVPAPGKRGDSALASVSRHGALTGASTRLAVLLNEKNLSFDNVRGMLERAMAKAVANLFPDP